MTKNFVSGLTKNEALSIGNSDFDLSKYIIPAGIILSILCGAAVAFGKPAAVIIILAVMLALFTVRSSFSLYCVLIGLIGFEAINAIEQRELYSITGAKIVGFLLMISLVPPILSRKIKFKHSSGANALILFMVGILCSFLSSQNLKASATAGLTMLQLAILWLITQFVLTKLGRLKLAGIISVLTLSVSAVVGIIQFIQDPASRISGISQNAAILSADLFVALFFGYALYRTAEKNNVKLFWGIVMLLVFGGLLCTLSRAAYIAFIPAVLVASAFYGKSKKAAKYLVGIIILVAIIAPFAFKRLAETSMQTDPTTRGHYMSIVAGLELLKDHPLFGVGIGNYPDYYLKYTNDVRGLPRSPHNSYLAIGSEAGIVTLLLFLAIHYFAFRELWKSSERQRALGNRKNLFFIAATAGALSAFCIIGLFHTLHYSKYLWILLAIANYFPLENGIGKNVEEVSLEVSLTGAESGVK